MINQNCSSNYNKTISNNIITSISNSNASTILNIANKIDTILSCLQEDRIVGSYSGSIGYNLTEVINNLNKVIILHPVVKNNSSNDAGNANTFAVKTLDPPYGAGLIILGDCGCKSGVTLNIIKSLSIGEAVPLIHLDFLCCLSTLLRQIAEFICHNQIEL